MIIIVVARFALADIYCSKCGKQNKDGYKFCITCGTLLVTPPVAAPEQKIKKIAKEKVVKKSKDPVPEMVYVPGGCYRMGDTFGDGDNDEKPVHEVCVDSFYIGKYEVTQNQWQKVMGNNPSHFSYCGGDCPVEQVSWNETQEFVRKLNSQAGKSYRLPTEAEWEYAARSGGKREKFAGGDDVNSVAWYGSNAGSKTHPVGQKQPNGLGIYDMSGNVWEWVEDIYSNSAYSSHSRNNPIYTGSGAGRVVRSGCWYNELRHVRAAIRNSFDPGFGYSFLGFRLARTK